VTVLLFTKTTLPFRGHSLRKGRILQLYVTANAVKSNRQASLNKHLLQGWQG